MQLFVWCTVCTLHTVIVLHVRTHRLYSRHTDLIRTTNSHEFQYETTDKKIYGRFVSVCTENNTIATSEGPLIVVSGKLRNRSDGIQQQQQQKYERMANKNEPKCTTDFEVNDDNEQ